MGVSVGQEVLDSSLRVANDVVAGNSFNQSLSNNARNSYKTLVSRAINKLDQTGGRRKRASKRKAAKNRKTVPKRGVCGSKKSVRKTQGKKRSLPKSTSKKRDIFG
ncbi:hypothetical protein GCK72_013061 [Caenorhabditis remanei]|uniref:Uncharacterized protein n=1 Tax=Caenorhabditis remanei TaxID=31234 RepID=A0A6A5GML6_CAERE|nr:hypothetical protein GCK72_013061 [Caenorhabditis remanei]KAF1756608.1 hypothetical protein GCK72_013061 [Caenorhabditis remanei]